jgi:hypothetical protein
LYSLFLKRFLVIDVLVFALLYTLRVIAGHLATGIPFSLWVLSCAFFLFLILAYGKRDQILIPKPAADLFWLVKAARITVLVICGPTGVAVRSMNSLTEAKGVQTPLDALLTPRSRRGEQKVS